jgi:hypothetical protein
MDVRHCGKSRNPEDVDFKESWIPRSSRGMTKVTFAIGSNEQIFYFHINPHAGLGTTKDETFMTACRHKDG